MEQIQQHKKNKKKDRKPIYLLLGFILFFSIFTYFITRPSLQSKAIEQIQVCTNVNDVKSLFDKYKFDLIETDEVGNRIVSLEFQDAVRNRLNSFSLNQEEIRKCLEWLPPAKTSINVIVIPDLSRRIIDTLNNPNQIENDLFVLNTIWSSFVNYSKLKQDSKDMLMVDVTDKEQAKGQFDKVANQLLFDLSEHKGKSNRLYFTPDKDSQFKKSIITMYQFAKEKPLGADYVSYFRRYLVSNIKKTTLYDNYVNKVIIITDGYLEVNTDNNGVKNYTPRIDQLYNSISIGNTKDVITMLGLNIPKVSIDLSNTDVLVCEINERKCCKNKDYEILKAYWEDWVTRMNGEITFVERKQANELTKKTIEDFLKD